MTTIGVQAVIGTIDTIIEGLAASLAELLEENPDVKDLSGDSLQHIANTGDSLTLSGEFLRKWGGARSQNGAIIELTMLRDAMLLFDEIRPLMDSKE